MIICRNRRRRNLSNESLKLVTHEFETAYQ